MSNPKIIVLIDYYLPGFKAGGPIRSLANMIEWFGDEFEFYVLTSDRDINDPRPFPGIKQGIWHDVFKAKVMYLTHRQKRWCALRRIFGGLDYDILYLNGSFPRICINLLILRRFGLIGNKPTILAPRGEFTKGALALKWFKKKIFLIWARNIKLYKDIIWQASSGQEKQDILAIFGKAITDQLNSVQIASDLPSSSIMIAPNLAESNLLEGEKSQFIKIPNIARIVFISRISRMKNLDYTLRILKGVKGEIVFDIYGPIEDGKYWRECQGLIADLPPNVKVTYRGELDSRRVVEVFSTYHIFFFPTRGENYGHVIFESLCGGCPVLTSDQTPWRGLVEKKAGWDLALSKPEAFQAALNELIAMDDKEYTHWSTSARAYSDSIISNPNIIEANRQLFRKVLKK